MKKDKILVCVDDTNHALTALKYACFVAKAKNISVQILAVIEPVGFQGLLSIVNTMEEEKRKSIKKNIQDLAEKAYQLTGVKSSSLIKEGNICDEIIKEIKKNNNISALVMGKSKDSKSYNILIPSIASKMGTDINIPLVIIPNEIDDKNLEKLCT